MAGSTQSKRWRIESLYRYKRAKTSRMTVLNIRLLTLNCMFTFNGAREFLGKMMRAQHLKKMQIYIFDKQLFVEHLMIKLNYKKARRFDAIWTSFSSELSNYVYYKFNSTR